MKTYVIDHEKYGQMATFKSLKEAQDFIRGCGSEFQSTEFREDSGDIFDEAGHIVGNVETTDLTFALALSSMRRQSGLSQVQASELLGIPRSTWQAWEAGLRVPASYVAAGVLSQFKLACAETLVGAFRANTTQPQTNEKQ